MEKIYGTRWIDSSTRTAAEKLAYFHGCADAEAEAWREIRRIRDRQLTAFFYGLCVGATVVTVVAAVANP